MGVSSAPSAASPAGGGAPRPPWGRGNTGDVQGKMRDTSADGCRPAASSSWSSWSTPWSSWSTSWSTPWSSWSSWSSWSTSWSTSWRRRSTSRWTSRPEVAITLLVTVFLHPLVVVQAATRPSPAPPPPSPTPPAPPSSPTQGPLAIRVTSSAHLLLVMVNDRVVANINTSVADIMTSHLDYTSWELSSGIHLMVLHPHDGSLMMRRTLTTALYGSSHEVPSVLMSLTPGHLIVMAIKNDAARNLTPVTRRLLARLGVRSARTLAEREALAWVATLGGPVWAEARTANDDDEQQQYSRGVVWASGVSLEVLVPRGVQDDTCFTDGPREEERASFCRMYDGYGDLCSCLDPAPLTYHAPELEGSAILDVPLLVLASNRPTYLYRCVVTLLQQAGGTRERILVLVDGHHQEVAHLLQLLQVRYEEREAEGVSVGARISDHYRHGLGLAFTRFPEASKAILLEDDLLVSPDFFSYFNQTSWLLESDPSLCCVSGWSDLGSLHVAREPRVLRRVEVLPGLGWMVARDTVADLLKLWPSPQEDHDWDIWVRQPGVLGGRECVVPDVSRTFHIGLMGSHAAGLLHAAFFASKPMPAQPQVLLLEVHRLTLVEYEEDLYRVLEGDPLILESHLHPCHTHYLPRNITGRPVVVFIEMSAPGDYYAWQVFARCLGLWDLDTRAHHRGLFRFYFYDTEVLVIGVPFSDYSYLKPPWVSVIRVNTSSSLSTLDLMPLTHRVRFRRPELERYSPYLDVATPLFS